MKHQHKPHDQSSLQTRLQHLAGFSGVPHWSFDGQHEGSHATQTNSAHKSISKRALTLVNPLVVQVRKLLSWISEERQFRENIRELKSLNDHALRDIGLHRGDIAALAHRVHTTEELNAERELLARPACKVVPISSVKIEQKPVKVVQPIDNAA